MSMFVIVATIILAVLGIGGIFVLRYLWKIRQEMLGR